MEAAFAFGQACVFIRESLPADRGIIAVNGRWPPEKYGKGRPHPAPSGAFSLNQRAQLAAAAPADETVHPRRPPIPVEENDLSFLQRWQNLAVDRVDVGGDVECLLGEHRHVADAKRPLVVVHAVDKFSETARLLAGEREQEQIMATAL